MTLYLNRVTLAGNLTRDPQVRFLANEQAVADFGLAINRRYKTKEGEAKEEVTFVDITAWGRTAELVGQYLTKGSPCYIEGHLKLEGWETQAGEKRQKLKVVADTVQFLGSKRESATGAHAAKPYDSAAKRANDAIPAKKDEPVVILDDEEPPF